MSDTTREVVTFGADIPEGYIPIGYVAAIKCLDTKGGPVLIYAESEDISSWEAAGMLRAATLRNEVLLDLSACGLDDDDDDDDELEEL